MGNKIKNKTKAEQRVKASTPLIQDPYITLSLVLFHFDSVSIDGFNNYYKDGTDYIARTAKIFTFFRDICKITLSDFKSNGNLRDNLHIHSVGSDKLPLLQGILKAYCMNEASIQDIVAGGNIGQIECYGAGKEIRLVYQLSDAILYPLFIDTNHHIYFNKSLVGESMLNNYCPYTYSECASELVILEGCKLVKCNFAEYFDKEKMQSSFSYTCNPINIT